MYKVMICDDEVYIRNMLSLNLDWKKYDLKVEFLESNGINGFSQFCANPVDIIITDIKMPLMSGTEMTRKIRDMDKRVEFIFLTSYGEFEYAKNAVDVGACGFVLKPIQNGYLQEALEKAISNLQMKDGLTPAKAIQEDKEDATKLIISEVNSYIKKNINKKLTLKEIAEEFHYSPNYLGHIYKLTTGMQLNDYVVKQKMEIASKMLKVPMYQIGDIAVALGYINMAHFFKQFKNYWGVTPKVYRNNNGLS